MVLKMAEDGEESISDQEKVSILQNFIIYSFLIQSIFM